MNSLTQFMDSCQVWFMEDYWHVRVNTKRDLATDLALGEYCRTLSSNNPLLPIQFSSIAPSIVWVHKGQISCPFEPAVYSIGPQSMSVEWCNFDPTSGLKAWDFNPQTGTYHISWNNQRLDQDRHTELKTDDNMAAYIQWGANKEAIRKPFDKRPGWDEILSQAFNHDHSVRYAVKRRIAWQDQIEDLMDVKQQRINLRRANAAKPTSIEDTSIYERGAVVHGRLVVTRVIRQRDYNWVSSRTPMIDRSVWRDTDYNRTDGPAHVTLYGVKETIMEDKATVLYPGGYSTMWYRAGRPVPAANIERWAKSTGTILVDAPCHDRPAFANAMDQSMWWMVSTAG